MRGPKYVPYHSKVKQLAAAQLLQLSDCL